MPYPPLAAMTEMNSLYLSYNQIGDVSPLEGMTRMIRLHLTDNQVSDISPLVANPGIGMLDTVDLEWNPLSSESLHDDMPELCQRGAEVQWTDADGFNAACREPTTALLGACALVTLAVLRKRAAQTSR